MLIGKVAERHGRGDFKERGRARVAHLQKCLNEMNHLVLRNHLAIDTDALTKVDEVR